MSHPAGSARHHSHPAGGRLRHLRPLLVAVPVAGVLAVAGWSLDGSQLLEATRAWSATPVCETLRALFMPLGKADLQVVVALLAGAIGLRRRACAALVALLVTGLLVAALKPAVGRVRPSGEDDSFPSGDTASAAAVATALVAGTPALWPVATAAVTAVGTFRVLDGRHHPSDVTAGAGLGLLIGIAAGLGARRLRRPPSSRFFAVAAGLGALVLAVESQTDWSERHLTGLAVLLPPLLLLAVARWGRVLARRGRAPMALLRAAPVLAAATSLALCWVLASGSTLWDRDEPRFARAAVEMLASGDWLVPTFNGALRPDKPAGIYWLMATSVRMFGASEWAVRLWAGLGVALAVLLIGRFAARRLGPREGALAAVIVALSPLAVVAGTAATTDGVLLAAVTLATVLVADGLLDGFTVGRTLALGLVLGLGQLVKGPVALVVPVLAGACWLVMVRPGGGAWRRPAAALAAALAIGLAVFLAWALPANAATGGEFARIGIGHHVLARASRPLESHGGSFLLHLPYYLGALSLGMLPWSLWLPGTLAAVWRRRLGRPDMRRLLVVWIAPLTVVLTVVSTKLPHYILPVVPALAAAIALGLVAVIDRPQLAAGRWWSLGRWLFRAAGYGFALALVTAVWWLPVVDGRRFVLGLAATVAVATWLGSRYDRRGEQVVAIAVLAVATAVGFLQLRALLPVVDALKPAPPIAAAVRAAAPSTLPVAASGFCEPSLAFYLGRGFAELDRDAVSAWLDEHPESILIGDAEVAAAVAGDPHLTEIARVHGYNLAKGKWVDVVALRRGRASGE